jgi:Na+-transporting NADH:ubiquinone oxidoreductase subunit NqrE
MSTDHLPVTSGVLPSNVRRLLWGAIALDVMAMAWMLSAGDWLDTSSRVASVVTLGGHHALVLWLAAAGFLMLTVLAVLTRGFVVVTRLEVPFLVLAAVVSVVAASGVLSVAVLLGLLAVAGRVLFGGGRRW